MKRLFIAMGLAAAMALGNSVRAADAPAAQVNDIKVLPDQDADCSSLKSIDESVTRDCKTNDEKAIAIYNFMLLTHFHCNYANEPGGIAAIKEINVYGWGVCGGTHSVESALWEQMGWKWRFIGWPGHTTVEAQYDGRWHYFDAFLKWYAWIPDGKGGLTVASEADLETNRTALWDTNFVYDASRKCAYFKGDQPVMDGKPNWRARELLGCDAVWMCVPDKKDPAEFAGGVPKAKQRSNAGAATSWGGYNHADGNYSAAVNLSPGLVLTNTWDPIAGAYNWGNSKKPPTHSCGHYADICNSPGLGLVLEPYDDPKTYPHRTYANGTLSFVPDFSDPTMLSSFLTVENVKYENKSLVAIDSSKPAFVIACLASPYVITKATAQIAGSDNVQLSADDGKTFAKADLADFAAPLKNKYVAELKIDVTKPVTAIDVNLTVQNNPDALPYLSPGKNIVAISVADPKALGTNKLVVTYVYRLGSRSVSMDKLAESGKRLANQTDAKWSDQLTYVRKVLTAADLPAKVEIDCPTPKGQYPVYPRMEMLQRQVISANETPLPLPQGAVAASVGPDDELPGLPSPFTVGLKPPVMSAQLPAATPATGPAADAR